MPERPTQTENPPTATDVPVGPSGIGSHGPPLAARYVLGDEIARGGMGAVHYARDTALDREVAVKVLRGGLPAGAARRFADEARITARLQHPNIPPVHDLGALPDGRPFLAMKLIRGDTLDALLKRRPGPGAERGRFVAAFEQVCQAVGYAHAHGVVHRDLKPANVMVGGFGEVQVMDWGIAKVLSGAADPEETSEADPAPAGDALTAPGSVLGTPAFMPPEQASGAVGQIDRRADVFGLGAILAVVLTGKPPYTGNSTEVVRAAAAGGRLGECFARLDASGADPELVALAKRCLAPAAADRPADGKAVADAVAALRQAAEDRARTAELDRVRAEVQAAEQRKRRRARLAAAAALAAVLLAGAGFAWWFERREATTRVAALKAREEAEAADRRRVDGAVRASAELLDQYRFADARRALDAAAEQLPPDAPAELRDRLAAARADLDLVRELDDIRYGRVRGNPTGGGERMSAAYRAAFARHGVDPAAGAPEALAWVNGSRVKRFVLVALDAWARYEPDEGAQDRLAALTRAADPAPASELLRDPAVWRGRDPVARAAFLERVKVDALPVNLLVLYFQVRDEGWPAPAAEYARAATRFPGDFWVQFETAYYHTFKRQNFAESVGFLRAALACRPDHVYGCYLLGRALDATGRHAEAVDPLVRALELDPGYADARVLLDLVRARIAPSVPKPAPVGDGGRAAFARGERAEAAKRWAEAAKQYQAATDQGYDPASAYYRLGIVLREDQKLDEAEAALRTSLRHDPNRPYTYYDLNSVYRLQQRWPEAAKCCEEFIARDATFAYAYNDLALARAAMGQFSAAVEACEQAARVAPGDKNIRIGLEKMRRLRDDHTAPPPREKR